MNRRRWLQGAVGASAALSATAAADGIETGIVRLKLKHTWTTVMSSSSGECATQR